MTETRTYIAKTFSGLEETLWKELRGLGAKNLKTINRGVQFEGNTELMYKANYQCRTALRILMPIANFQARDEQQLYDEIFKIDWEQYIRLKGTFAIDGITSYSNINHSKYLALKSKDAIADQFRGKFGKRPNVNTDDPDVKINIRLFRNGCSVSLDSSGESLHKRGYRLETGPAPINEVLAAGLIQLSGWDAKSNFIDPMCGSGTIPIEAAMLALNIPAGFFREEFNFERWSDFDEGLWEKVKADAKKNETGFTHQIIGSDRSGKILQVARQNVRSANLEKQVKLWLGYVEDSEPPEGKGVMITNPPYGERIKVDDINKLYKGIGDNLKKNYAGYSAWIFSSDENALRQVGLKPSKKIKLYNGPIETSFCKYEIFEGRKEWFEKKELEKNNDNPNNTNTEKPKKKRKRIVRE
ncbi:MAG: class I SAM-dependent RNA methyltransferase [Chlorobi bacterium]|nr:class I SAM-dependent RNA methyltransferase [Chlorobiota bacterium]